MRSHAAFAGWSPHQATQAGHLVAIGAAAVHPERGPNKNSLWGDLVGAPPVALLAIRFEVLYSSHIALCIAFMCNAPSNLFGRSRRNQKLVAIVPMPSSQITVMISLISKVSFAEVPKHIDNDCIRKCVINTTRDTAATAIVHDSQQNVPKTSNGH